MLEPTSQSHQRPRETPYAGVSLGPIPNHSQAPTCPSAPNLPQPLSFTNFPSHLFSSIVNACIAEVTALLRPSTVNVVGQNQTNNVTNHIHLSPNLSADSPDSTAQNVNSTRHRPSTATSSSGGSHSDRLLLFLRTPSSQSSRQLDVEDVNLLSPMSTKRLLPEGMEHRPQNCDLDEISIDVPNSRASSRRLSSRDSLATSWRLPVSFLTEAIESDLQTPTSPSNEIRPFGPEPTPDNDTPDPALLALEEANGNITAGTVEGLIERLINDSPAFIKDIRKRMEYRDAFLMSYVAFTTADTVFKFLVRRFAEAANFGSKRRGILRYNVIAMMKHWLESPLVRVEMGVQWKIKEFAHSIASSADATDHMVALANSVIETIDLWITSQDHIRHSPTRSYASSSKPIGPGGFANALTALEGKKYSHLVPTDYFFHFLHPSTEGSIADAHNTNKMITDWVKKSILIPKDYGDRAEVFKFFVNTAVECHKIRNFASMAAIVNALQSPSIRCLCAVRWVVEEKSPRVLDALSRLRRVIGEGPLHLSYHAALEKSEEPCIPWIDAHLLGLSAVVAEHPPTVEYMGRTLINFKRYFEFSSRVRKLLQHKALPDNPEAMSSLTYIEDQIYSTHWTEDSIVKRSRALEVEEKRLNRQRLPQFRKAGFRI